MNYTKEDKICNHCGGEIWGHLSGEIVIYWCEKCGANDKEELPKVTLTLKP